MDDTTEFGTISMVDHITLERFGLAKVELSKRETGQGYRLYIHGTLRKYPISEVVISNGTVQSSLRIPVSPIRTVYSEEPSD